MRKRWRRARSGGAKSPAKERSAETPSSLLALQKGSDFDSAAFEA